MGYFDRNKEKKKSAEDMEDFKECNFEIYDENDGKFYCGACTASILCNKLKCPFWKK